MSTNSKTYLPNSSTCFVCGDQNPLGLKLRFYVEDGIVKTVFNPEPDHCGYKDVLHGGLVATILDETMGWAANRAMHRMTVTAELKIRYLKPTPGHKSVHAQAEIVKAHKRLCYVKAQVQSEDGEVFATAESRFFPLSPEDTLKVDEHLVYQDGDERIFDPLRTVSE